MLNSRGGTARVIKNQKPVLQVSPEPPLVMIIETEIKREILYEGKQQKNYNQTEIVKRENAQDSFCIKIFKIARAVYGTQQYFCYQETGQHKK